MNRIIQGVMGQFSRKPYKTAYTISNRPTNAYCQPLGSIYQYIQCPRTHWCIKPEKNERLKRVLYRGNICIHAKKRDLRTIEVMIARHLLWIYTLDSQRFLIEKIVCWSAHLPSHTDDKYLFSPAKLKQSATPHHENIIWHALISTLLEYNSAKNWVAPLEWELTDQSGFAIGTFVKSENLKPLEPKLGYHKAQYLRFQY